MKIVSFSKYSIAVLPADIDHQFVDRFTAGFDLTVTRYLIKYFDLLRSETKAGRTIRKSAYALSIPFQAE
jgi:hypothetical protein